MALVLTVPSGNFHLAGNPINVEVTGAVAPAGSSNYKILLKITSIDSLLVGSPFIDGVLPIAGKATFDVSGYVDQPLFRAFEYPLSGGVNPYVNDTFDIKFAAGESWIDANGDLQETMGTNGETHFVVKGGVSNRKLGLYKDAEENFYEDYVLGGKFLTHMPLSQVVSLTQPVKLWLLAAVSEPGYLRIRASYSDGSFYVYESTHGLYADILHEINCIPTHADAENMPMVKYDLSGNIVSRMISYQVWFEEQTEVRTFLVDHSHYENNNYLFVLNSLGGIDVVWLHGHVKYKFTSEMTTAEKPRLDSDGAKVPTLVVSNRTGHKQWTINTGFKPAEEIEALMELALSRQAWLLIDGALYPVIISLADETMRDSMEYLYSIDLNIEEAHKNSYL